MRKIFVFGTVAMLASVAMCLAQGCAVDDGIETATDSQDVTVEHDLTVSCSVAGKWRADVTCDNPSYSRAVYFNVAGTVFVRSVTTPVTYTFGPGHAVTEIPGSPVPYTNQSGTIDQSPEGECVETSTWSEPNALYSVTARGIGISVTSVPGIAYVVYSGALHSCSVVARKQV